MIIQGKLWEVVHWVTIREKGGVLLLTTMNPNTYKLVVDVLVSKKLTTINPEVEAFHPYGLIPIQIDLDITANTIKFMEKTTQGQWDQVALKLRIFRIRYFNIVWPIWIYGLPLLPFGICLTDRM